jgi:hypothetical protein
MPLDSRITQRPPARVRERPERERPVHQLRDEAANPRSMQREGDAVGGDVNAVDQQAEDARLLGRIQLVPHRLKRAKRLDGLSWDAR